MLSTSEPSHASDQPVDDAPLRHATSDSANLDLLRTVAVSCVGIAHIGHFITGEVSELDWHLGQLGVLMFFVHTSLVLMFSLERTKATGYHLFQNFYLRRAFRIYPLSIVMVLFVYFSHYPPTVEMYRETFSVAELITNLTLTQNLFYHRDLLGVLWSLPLEVQMYIFLPFLFIWFRRSSVWPLLAVWVVSVAAAWFQTIQVVPGIGRLSVIGYGPCFVAGVLTWRLSKQARPRLSGWLWPLGLALTTLVWFAADREHNMYFRWAFCLVLGLAIPFFREIPSARIHAITKTIAKYSYGVYLGHQYCMMVSFRMLHQPWLQWPVFVAMMVLVPFLMYHLIEHPGIEWGKRLARRLAP
jgi:peptidoglycan/LPS O-acetylase OafA/YrhL